MFGLDNPVHIVLLLVVLLLVFGAKRLPDVGKSLGEGLRGFKTSIAPVTSLKDSLSLTADQPTAAPVHAGPASAASVVPAPVPVAATETEQPVHATI
jgi:sec-independent protein translocase protein TatA